MWIGVVENFHISDSKLNELERLESLIMGESGVNSYTLQPLAHYAKLFTLEISPSRPASAVICDAPPALAAAPFFLSRPQTVYGAAEFIRPFEDGFHAHLFGFYIDESLRGGGAASLFLEACEKRLRDGYSIVTIDLSVSEHNARALAFYTKNGYREAEKAADYYGAGRDRIIMRKTIGDASVAIS